MKRMLILVDLALIFILGGLFVEMIFLRWIVPRGHLATLVALAIVVMGFLLSYRLLGSVHYVPEGHVAVIERAGRFHGIARPGTVLLIPLTDRVRTQVATHERIVECCHDNVRAVGGVSLSSISVIVRYQVGPKDEDIRRAVYNVHNWEEALKSQIQAAVHSVVAGMQLPSDILGMGEAPRSRQDLNKRIQTELSLLVQDWGISINSVQVTKLDVKDEILQGINAERKAEKDARLERIKAEAKADSIRQVEQARLEAWAGMLNRVLETIGGDLRSDARSFLAARYIEVLHYIEALDQMARGDGTKVMAPQPPEFLLGVPELRIGGSGAAETPAASDAAKPSSGDAAARAA